MNYLALIRGINVGGNNLIKMSELTHKLSQIGLINVRAYIQSGNQLFESSETSTLTLATQISKCIESQFQVTAGVAVFSKERWQEIIQTAPPWWGKDPAWKHTIFALLDPAQLEAVLAVLNDLKPDIELIAANSDVIYQSLLVEKYNQTSTSKLPSKPEYKCITIRNFNTVTTLADVLYFK